MKPIRPEDCWDLSDCQCEVCKLNREIWLNNNYNKRALKYYDSKRI